MWRLGRPSSFYIFPGMMIFLLALCSVARAAQPDEASVTAQIAAEWDCTQLEGYQTMLGLNMTCIFLEMPLDHADPSKGTFLYFARQITAQGAVPRNVMFMIQGGPGAPGDALIGFETYLYGAGLDRNDWAFVVPDHRGTGRSMQLTCPDGSEVDTPTRACYDHYTKNSTNVLPYMSVHNAAMDTYVAANTLGAGPNNTYVYAVSYGTNLMLKYLVVAPTENLAAVVLDSVAPTMFGYNRFGEFTNIVAMQYMTKCDLEGAVCNLCMGPNPIEQVDTIFQETYFGVNECMGIVQAKINGTAMEAAALLRGILAWGFTNSANTRDLMLPLLYRLKRCTETDAAEVMAFIQAYINAQYDGDDEGGDEGGDEDGSGDSGNGEGDSDGQGGAEEEGEAAATPSLADGDPGWQLPTGDGSSQVLYYNLMLAELYAIDRSKAATPQQLAVRVQNTLAGADQSQDYITLEKYWRPQYNVSQKEAFAYPVLKNTSLLLLAGTLDPQTVAAGAQWAFENTDAPYKAIYFFDDVVHGSFTKTTLPGVDPMANGTCATQIIAQLILQGEVGTAAECMGELEKPDWNGEQNDTALLAVEYFGTDQVWGSCEANEMPNTVFLDTETGEVTSSEDGDAEEGGSGTDVSAEAAEQP